MWWVEALSTEALDHQVDFLYSNMRGVPFPTHQPWGGQVIAYTYPSLFARSGTM